MTEEPKAEGPRVEDPNAEEPSATPPENDRADASPGGPTTWLLQPATGKEEVFISYSRADSRRVYALLATLRDAGVSVWLDVGGLEGGESWREELGNAIAGCKVVLLMASKTAVVSKWVTKEITYASQQERRIIPVFLEECELPRKLDFLLTEEHRETFYEEDLRGGLRRVGRALRSSGVGGNLDALRPGVYEKVLGGMQPERPTATTDGRSVFRVGAVIAGLVAVAIGIWLLTRPGPDPITPKTAGIFVAIDRQYHDNLPGWIQLTSGSDTIGEVQVSADQASALFVDSLEKPSRGEWQPVVLDEVGKWEKKRAFSEANKHSVGRRWRRFVPVKSHKPLGPLLDSGAALVGQLAHKDEKGQVVKTFPAMLPVPLTYEKKEPPE